MEHQDEQVEPLEHTESHPPRWRKRLIVALMVIVTASIVGRAYYSQTRAGEPEARGPGKSSPVGPAGLVPTTGPDAEPQAEQPEPSTTEKVLPFVTEGGLAMLLGVALGMATRFVAKIVVFLFALVFVAMQYLAYKGIVQVDWGQFKDVLNNLILNFSGEHGIGAIVKHKLPSAASLGVGYYLGLKRG